MAGIVTVDDTGVFDCNCFAGLDGAFLGIGCLETVLLSVAGDGDSIVTADGLDLTLDGGLSPGDVNYFQDFASGSIAVGDFSFILNGCGITLFDAVF